MRSGHDKPRGAQQRTRLMFHSARGDMAGVLASLRFRADVRRSDTSGKTALLWASQGGHLDIMRVLVDAGADVQHGDTSGKTALLWACKGGHVDVVNALIDAGADVDAVDDCTTTALMAASGGGHSDVVHVLLDAGADIDATCIGGEGTALCYAAAGGHEVLARELLARGAATEVEGEASALAAAAAAAPAAAADGGLLGLVRDLVETHGANVDATITDPRSVSNDTPCTALWLASSRGYVEIVRYLAGQGADIDAGALFGESPLCAACMRGHADAAKELLDRGALIYNRTGQSVVCVAARESSIVLSPSIVGLLCEVAMKREAAECMDDSTLWAEACRCQCGEDGEEDGKYDK